MFTFQLLHEQDQALASLTWASLSCAFPRLALVGAQGNCLKSFSLSFWTWANFVSWQRWTSERWVWHNEVKVRSRTHWKTQPSFLVHLSLLFREIFMLRKCLSSFNVASLKICALSRSLHQVTSITTAPICANYLYFCNTCYLFLNSCPEIQFPPHPIFHTIEGISLMRCWRISGTNCKWHRGFVHFQQQLLFSGCSFPACPLHGTQC